MDERFDAAIRHFFDGGSGDAKAGPKFGPWTRPDTTFILAEGESAKYLISLGGKVLGEYQGIALIEVSSGTLDTARKWMQCSQWTKCKDNDRYSTRFCRDSEGRGWAELRLCSEVRKSWIEN